MYLLVHTPGRMRYLPIRYVYAYPHLPKPLTPTRTHTIPIRHTLIHTTWVRQPEDAYQCTYACITANL